MSAPLVVNTKDGTVWTRRTVTASGLALYAPEGVCKCPEFVMATLAELAEHGIVGSADVLPVPVGAEPLSAHAASIRLAQYGERTKTWSTATYESGTEKALHEIALALQSRVDEVERAYTFDTAELKRRIAELEAERRTTNEALDDAVQALRTRAEERPAPVPLSTDCANCGHTLNWHGGSGCSAGSAPARCGCRSFVAKAAVLVAASESKATKCRCAEPGVDPYECEAEDCTHEFSELNPFDGGPVQGHDAKVSQACGCGWQTSVWHVADGSAEAELHVHVVRVHGGVHPPKAGDQ